MLLAHDSSPSQFIFSRKSFDLTSLWTHESAPGDFHLPNGCSRHLHTTIGLVLHLDYWLDSSEQKVRKSNFPLIHINRTTSDSIWVIFTRFPEPSSIRQLLLLPNPVKRLSSFRVHWPRNDIVSQQSANSYLIGKYIKICWVVRPRSFQAQN